jgi:hypothetical protein
MSRTIGEEQLVTLANLAPDHQADVLWELAREARLLEFAVEGADNETPGVATDIGRALERVMDADSDGESAQARSELMQALARLEGCGLAIRAGVSRMQVDGLLGPMSMPVLTAVLSPISESR